MGGFKERFCSSEQPQRCQRGVCQPEAAACVRPQYPGRGLSVPGQCAGREVCSHARGSAGPDGLISCKTALLSELSSSDSGKAYWVG